VVRGAQGVRALAGCFAGLSEAAAEHGAYRVAFELHGDDAGLKHRAAQDTNSWGHPSASQAEAASTSACGLEARYHLTRKFRFLK